LSGGEPAARRDLVDITAGARAAGLYTNLITSAVGITDKTLDALARPGSTMCRSPSRTASLLRRPHRGL
jgi:MoaA/NifB/PqqE/SkfB family radical SAM enzyme